MTTAPCSFSLLLQWWHRWRELLPNVYAAFVRVRLPLLNPASLTMSSGIASIGLHPKKKKKIEWRRRARKKEKGESERGLGHIQSDPSTHN